MAKRPVLNKWNLVPNGGIEPNKAYPSVFLSVRESLKELSFEVAAAYNKALDVEASMPKATVSAVSRVGAAAASGGGGGGSVTSVGLTMPAVFSVAGSPITTTGTLAVTASGTSGGVPYFNAATTMASSAALTANAIVFGGGVGGAPATPLGLGTPTTVLHGNAAGAPTWAAVSLTADVSGILPLAGGGTGANLSATGGAGYYLKQASAGAVVTVGAIPASDISSGAALSKADDTNVTLSLGGSPTTALLAAASLTLGWSGQLAVSRGGTGVATFGGVNRLLYTTATDTLASITTANSSVLVTSGAGAPSWATDIPTAVTIGTAYIYRASGTDVAIADGGTGASTASAGFNALSPLTTLGDVIYGAASGAGTRLAGNTTTTRQFLRQTGDGVNSAAPAWDTVTKADVGLSAVENTALSTWAGTSNIVTVGTITSGTWNGTDVAVTAGGTGASDAGTARTNLGLAIGSDVQAYSANLAAIAALAVTDSNIIVGNGVSWVVESGATARASLGLTIGTDVPGPTGTGASGTWGISVSGNAATVTAGVYTTGSYADPAWLTSLAGSKITGNISGNAANVTGVVALVNGGTGTAAASANAAFNALSPLTTLGDVLYGAASGAGTRLAGNITTTRKFLRQTGTGAASAAPAWDTLVAGDIPDLSATYLVDADIGVAIPGPTGTGASGTWGISITGTSAGAPPTGAAGGNLGGTYPNPSIASLPAISGAALTALTAANISAGTAGINISGSAASCTGNAATATALATARAINGTNFDGTAAITVPVNNADDTTTAATMYPLWTATAGGNYAAKVSTTKLSFNPSTGVLTATGFAGALTGNVTGNVSGSSGSCTGNAATVTNGVYTGDIGVSVQAYSATLAAVAGGTYSGDDSIVTVGTIGAGVWQGTAVAAGYGGTGNASYTVGDLLYASGAAALSKLAAGTAGYVLTSGGAGIAPSWAAASVGTVTSVALSMPAMFTVSGSPVTTTGTLTAVLANQSPNLVFAGPAAAPAAAPTFRSLVAADIPDLSGTYLVDADIGVAIPGPTGTGASGSWGISVSGSAASCTGNAATVTNGVYTTGSYANPAWITSLAASKVGLGSVENTALSTWAGSANIITLGTITTGVWNAGAITSSGAISGTTGTFAGNLKLSGAQPVTRTIWGGNGEDVGIDLHSNASAASNYIVGKVWNGSSYFEALRLTPTGLSSAGAISATTGTFSGGISGTTGTFSGQLAVDTSGTGTSAQLKLTRTSVGSRYLQIGGSKELLILKSDGTNQHSFNDDGTVSFAGGISGTTGTFSGVLSVDDTTDASSTVTGSIHTDGGLGVAKKAYFGDVIVTAAPTTAIPSIRLPAGTAPTSPTEGDVWNDSTQKSKIVFVDGVRQYGVGLIFAQTANVTVANTTTPTSLVGSGVGTNVMPANSIVVGKSFRLVAMGYVSTGGSDRTMGFSVKAYGTVVTVSATIPANTTNALWGITVHFTCRTTGAGGTWSGQGFSQGPIVLNPNTSTSNLDTTAATTIFPEVTWGFGVTASDTITCTNLTLEVLC